MPDLPYEDVQIEGHLIDSLMMPQIMDRIMDPVSYTHLTLPTNREV